MREKETESQRSARGGRKRKKSEHSHGLVGGVGVWKNECQTHKMYHVACELM